MTCAPARLDALGGLGVGLHIGNLIICIYNTILPRFEYTIRSLEIRFRRSGSVHKTHTDHLKPRAELYNRLLDNIADIADLPFPPSWQRPTALRQSTQ